MWGELEEYGESCIGVGVSKRSVERARWVWGKLEEYGESCMHGCGGELKECGASWMGVG